MSQTRQVKLIRSAGVRLKGARASVASAPARNATPMARHGVSASGGAYGARHLGEIEPGDPLHGHIQQIAEQWRKKSKWNTGNFRLVTNSHQIVTNGQRIEIADRDWKPPKAS